MTSHPNSKKNSIVLNTQIPARLSLGKEREICKELLDKCDLKKDLNLRGENQSPV